MAKVNQWQIASKAIKLAESLNGYVFGGYVRDTLSGDMFKDIDLYLPTDHNKDAILEHDRVKDLFLNSIWD